MEGENSDRESCDLLLCLVQTKTPILFLPPPMQQHQHCCQLHVAVQQIRSPLCPRMELGFVSYHCCRTHFLPGSNLPPPSTVTLFHPTPLSICSSATLTTLPSAVGSSGFTGVGGRPPAFPLAFWQHAIECTAGVPLTTGSDHFTAVSASRRGAQTSAFPFRIGTMMMMIQVCPGTCWSSILDLPVDT